jgi:hypothetical protein
MLLTLGQTLVFAALLCATEATQANMDTQAHLHILVHRLQVVWQDGVAGSGGCPQEILLSREVGSATGLLHADQLLCSLHESIQLQSCALHHKGMSLCMAHVVAMEGSESA